MFAQKEKKSKIWIAVPVILALGVGLWLNAGLKDDTGEESIPAGSHQYERRYIRSCRSVGYFVRSDSSAQADGQNGAGSETADDSRYDSVPMIFRMTSAAITAAAA